MNTEKINDIIVRRAYKLNFENIYKLIDNRPFILAGGSLCGDKVNDFDIYPAAWNEFSTKDIEKKIAENKDEIVKKVKLISMTKNAMTLNVDGQTVQFCNYKKDTLKELVDSFDFAHIKVGIRFDGCNEPPHADGVYFADDFVLANVEKATYYTGSEYPTSSLIRIFKYAIRGKFEKRNYVRSVLKILSDIVKRGFVDYKDFKDQMDAIDLGLAEYKGAYELYDEMRRRGLVKNEK
jgi:hypothetical protein